MIYKNSFMQYPLAATMEFLSMVLFKMPMLLTGVQECDATGA